ncbi:MAG: response regulator transcription factor [Acetobacterium woodii]|nr:response regulator transcription factor [Acetobacterium woodii]
MLSIAVCEDEEHHKNLLVDLISHYQFINGYHLSAFQFGHELIAAMKKEKMFDAIFLDMRLENEDGIDIANEIRKTDERTHIIITTSLIEYAVLGYSVNASDFLLKPISQEKLYQILKKLEVDKIKSQSSYHEIEINKVKIVLRTDDILYFESLGRKIKIVTFDAEYEYYYNISVLEKELDAARFILCHRSYIVNLGNIKSIKKGSVILKTGLVIPISPKKNQKVYDEFTRYLTGDLQ